MKSATTCRTHYKKAGISLVEIMLAFLILCTAAFSAAGVISFGHRGTTVDFRQGEAMQILIDRLNKFSSMPFARLNSFLDSAGSNEHTFTNEIEDVILGNEVKVDKHSYRIRATFKRQAITFDSLMELSFPNPVYNPASPSTWLFQNRPSETFDGSSAPFAVIKVTVFVKPVGGLTDEREVSAFTFVTDMES
jgi:hypothetical protein